MPCCAFAAFIVGQILIGFDAFKRFVLGRGSSEVPTNAASEWRLGMPAAPARRRRIPLTWMVAAGSLEIALALGGGYALRAHLMHHSSGHANSHLVCRGPITH